MSTQKASRARKVITEICNRRRNSDIRADDREVQAAFDALLEDTGRLDFVLAVLQVRGVDGLFDLIWKPFNAFDRQAIDSARAVLDVNDLGAPVMTRPAPTIARDPAFGEMDAAWLDPPAETLP